MKTSSKTILSVGAGLAAIATAGYYFLGPEGKSNQKKTKGWMFKMKGEIIERIEDVKDLTESAYKDIVDSVAETFAETAKVSKSEIKAFAGRLKDQWGDLQDDAKSTTKRIAKKATR